MTPMEIRVLCLQLANACLDVDTEMQVNRNAASSGNKWQIEGMSARKASRRYRRLLLGLKLEASAARQYVTEEWHKTWELARNKEKRSK